jgi:methionyl aminopeptidase
MIDEEALEKHRQAGKITAQALEFGKSLIKVDASVVEVLDKIEAKIVELGGKPAFPAQISINEVAAHFCPTQNDTISFNANDLVKLDVGVHVDGYVGDSALTVDLGAHHELVTASKKALEEVLKMIKPGVTLGEIGELIQSTIGNYGFRPIKNLSGHSVGKFIVHGPPTIPNVATGDPTELEDGMVIAIEPFATEGAGMVYESGEATIFKLTGKKTPRSAFTREVLKEVEKYDGLPFTTRWLTKKFSLPKVSFALRELDNLEILKKFPPLPDKDKGLVSQHEHTVIVKDKPEIITKI